MATIRVAIDNCYGYSSDTKTLNTFAEKLRQAGHTVHTHGVGPNTIQGVMRQSKNKCDIAIQIAGGKCLGTLCDFYVGVQSGYYHASKMGFAYYKCYKPDWSAKREPRDNFSTKPGTRVKAEADKMTGKTLPQIFEIYKDSMVYGYGDTAEDCAKTFLQNLTGKSASANAENGMGNGGGSSILELIKQCVSDWDAYGVDMDLRGDTLYIKRSNPNKAVVMNEHNVLLNSVSFTDYDVSTPNQYGSVRDEYLLNRFGQIQLDDENGDSAWQDQFLLMSQRGHGHSIDLKCIINPLYSVGKWVSLTLEVFGIKDRKYMITKATYDDERTMSVTLESGPPSRYVEVQEVAEEEAEEVITEEEA